MRCSGIVALFFASFCALPSAVHAEGADTEWNALHREALDLYRADKYARAVEVAQKDSEGAEQNVDPDNSDVAASLNSLAKLYYTQGDYTKAELLYERSLAITENALGPDHPRVAIILNNLAELYQTQGDYAKAEPLY